MRVAVWTVMGAVSAAAYMMFYQSNGWMGMFSGDALESTAELL